MNKTNCENLGFILHSSLNQKGAAAPATPFRNVECGMRNLIAKAADRNSGALVAADAAHVGVIVAQAAVVCVRTIILRRTPEIGAVAGTAETTAVVVARRHSTETGGVVAGWRVAHGTGGCAGTPPCGGGQRLGDIAAVVAAQVVALAAHILYQLRPLAVARHVPPSRTDSLVVCTH